MDLGPVLHVWRQALTVDFLRYFLAAAPFYAVFWMWRPAWLRGRRIQSTNPEGARVLSEFAYSLSTILIFSAIGTTLVFAERAGLTRIYLSIAEHSRAYFWASIALAILAHDAYFYWTHQLLHWRPLFRLAHHVHHRSTSPTPWAAYAFHPLEALIQSGVYVVIVLVIPMHPLALILFLAYMILRNVVGHLGFEVWPAWFASHPLTRWHLTATHHDLHHRFGKGNYGLYFSFWDDMAGTGRSDYVETFETVTASRCAVPSDRRFRGGRAVHRHSRRSSDGEGGRCDTRGALEHDRRPHGRGALDRPDSDREGRAARPGRDGGTWARRRRRPGMQPLPRRQRGQRVVGMLILEGLRFDGNRWTDGRILDPENGKEYASTVCLDGDDRLRVRGYWGPFYRTQTWRRAPGDGVGENTVPSR